MQTSLVRRLSSIWDGYDSDDKASSEGGERRQKMKTKMERAWREPKKSNQSNRVNNMQRLHFNVNCVITLLQTVHM
jgi:hypothetical protein